MSLGRAPAGLPRVTVRVRDTDRGAVPRDRDRDRGAVPRDRDRDRCRTEG